MYNNIEHMTTDKQVYYDIAIDTTTSNARTGSHDNKCASGSSCDNKHRIKSV